MEIIKYTRHYEQELTRFLQECGIERYTCDTAIDNFKLSLTRNISFLALSDNVLCGFLRAIEDPGFSIYITDIVTKDGLSQISVCKALTEHLKSEYPERKLLLLSADSTLQNLSYPSVGMLFSIV